MDTTERASEGRDDLPRGSRTFPLNSRRLTTPLLRCIAAHLELPTSASAEDLRQMLDGKLVTMEREPREVQVVLAALELEAAADTLLLQDEEGVFLTVALTQDVETRLPVRGVVSDLRPRPLMLRHRASADGGDDDRERLLDEVEELREELNHMKVTVATERHNQEAELCERDVEIARLTE